MKIWHDESDRLATWGTLDPPDACMCTECVLTTPTTTGTEDES